MHKLCMHYLLNTSWTSKFEDYSIWFLVKIAVKYELTVNMSIMTLSIDFFSVENSSPTEQAKIEKYWIFFCYMDNGDTLLYFKFGSLPKFT